MESSICINRSVERRLDQLVKHTGRTKACLLREMIESRLEDLEDYYLASATMENIYRDKENIYSALDVRKGLGLMMKQSPKAALRGRQ
jgi:predicted DNA-binding protein